MRTILLKIAYDGSGFSGWQRQPNARTVCGTVEDALSELIGREMRIDGTSRTDAGVHALGQCASFRLEDGGIPTGRIPAALNALLARDRLEGIGDVRILSADEMPEGFHARYSSRGKRYVYRIFNSPDKSVFRRRLFYQVGEELDLEAMRSAAALLVGEHDFGAFMSSGGTPQESTVREIYSIRIEEDRAFAEAPAPFDAGRTAHGEETESFAPRSVAIAVEGGGFLYNMVRIIVGTLVEVGLGKRDPESVSLALSSRLRKDAGHTAPPQGLYLDEVFY